MKAPWLLIVSLTVWSSSAHGQGMARTGARRNPAMGVPVTSRPTTSTPSGDRTGTQGVLIDLDTNLGGGIYAELSQNYKEAVKLLTLAIADEHGEVIKLALAHRFRGLAYKHLGRRDEALNDFLEVIRIQPKLDLGYYDAGVIYNLTNRYNDAVDAMTRAIDLRHDDSGLARRRSEREIGRAHV